MSQNNSFVVWSSCFLWVTSLFAVAWSLLLFFCIGDILLLTGTDLINALVLLSGIIMLPTNVYMLCAIANGKKIDPKANVVCCPLWFCIIWIIVINIVGAALCIHRIYLCHESVQTNIAKGMEHYRNVPKYKRFMDTLQWSLKCCGLNSYKDWFNHDWYDRIRDYEWDPSTMKRFSPHKQASLYDSVPLSCCKSGSCISNYLLELGTSSIHTDGCRCLVERLIMTSMNGHLIMFVSIIIVEILTLRCISKKSANMPCMIKQERYNVRHIMPVNNKFEDSSCSCEYNPDDSDFEESVSGAEIRHQVDTKPKSESILTNQRIMKAMDAD